MGILIIICFTFTIIFVQRRADDIELQLHRIYKELKGENKP